MLYNSAEECLKAFNDNLDNYQKQNYRLGRVLPISTWDINVIERKVNTKTIEEILTNQIESNGNIITIHYIGGYNNKYCALNDKPDSNLLEYFINNLIYYIRDDAYDICAVTFENGKSFLFHHNHLTLSISTFIDILKDEDLYFVHNELRLIGGSYNFGI